jgi:protein O-mannosyl-transferase
VVKRSKRKTKPVSGSAKADDRSRATGGREGPGEWIVLAGLALVTILTFANGLHGEFVYDDKKQIVQNQLIQDRQYFWKALASDVWAFKGNSQEPWSNYWRPAFVAWLMANDRLFGVSDPRPWHISNLFLHLIVIGCAYGLLRRVGMSRWSTAAVVLLFAVHPTHVESVTWISGSPDLLLAVCCLVALWCVLSAEASGGPGKRAVAFLLAFLAMLVKETGVVFPLVVFFSVLALGEEGTAQRDRLRRAVRASLPFVVAVFLYLALRLATVGRLSSPGGRPNIATMLLTAPSLLTFYARQAVFPLWIGPSYPLRPVEVGRITTANFWLPLAILGVGLLVLRWVIRWGRVERIGLALFLLFLLPVFNVGAFLPEQIAHDRYLYLPLLGFLMFLPGVTAGWGKKLGRNSSALSLARGGALVLVCAGLLMQTIRYNTAWISELRLWQWAVRSDPTSAFNWSQYGVTLYEAGRLPEAKEALSKALEIAPVTNALITRADIATGEGRFPEAAKDLELVLSDQPENTLAYERLAIVYQKSGRFDDAATLLRKARERVPYWRCAFTTNLAVVLYLSGKKQEALRELESLRDQVTTEYSSTCRMGLFHLGQLYREQGRAAEARSAFQEFLASTQTIHDKQILKLRTIAEGLLERAGP